MIKWMRVILFNKLKNFRLRIIMFAHELKYANVGVLAYLYMNSIFAIENLKIWVLLAAQKV